MLKPEFNAINKDKQREYWTGHIQEWKRSNLKQQAYCIKACISYSSFVYWKGILFPSESKNTHKTFVPVKITSEESGKSNIPVEIKIRLTTGHVVCIPLTMELEKISRLIHLLGISHA